MKTPGPLQSLHEALWFGITVFNDRMIKKNIKTYLKTFCTWQDHRSGFSDGMITCELSIFALQQEQNLGQRFGTSKVHLSSPVA